MNGSTAVEWRKVNESALVQPNGTILAGTVEFESIPDRVSNVCRFAPITVVFSMFLDSLVKNTLANLNESWFFDDLFRDLEMLHNVTDVTFTNNFTFTLFLSNTTIINDTNFDTWIGSPVEFCLSAFNFSDTWLYLSRSLVASLFVIIVIGNGLILSLTYFEKSLRSPIFMTIQSLSANSLLYDVSVCYTTFAPCSFLKYPRVCDIVTILTEFIRKMIFFHLCFLSGQRIFMTLYPLKARVVITKKFTLHMLICTYAVCLILEVIFNVSGVNSCTEDYKMYNIWYIFCIFGITGVMFVLVVIISMVQNKISASVLQTNYQRQQSKLASFVIILFMTIYCPILILYYVIHTICITDTLVFIIAEYLSRHLQLVLLAINPTILCLRLKTVRQRFKNICCQKLCKNNSE